MRISDWSSDVCSSDLSVAEEFPLLEMLHAAGIAVPAPLWPEAESQVLGGAYSVSQPVAGVGRGTSSSETGITPAMIKAMAILLAQAHSLAWQTQASSPLPSFGLHAGPATRTTGPRADHQRGGSAGEYDTTQTS